MSTSSEKLEKEKEEILHLLNKKFDWLKRKKNNLLKNIEHCKQWTQIQKEADLIKYHYASIPKKEKMIHLKNWENEETIKIEFRSSNTLHEEMTERYKKAKKFQHALEYLTKELNQIGEDMQALQMLMESILETTTSDSLIDLKKNWVNSNQPTKQLKDKHSQVPYREYLSSTGQKIWVGKNAKANEKLTFHYANGNDWWLHASGYAGSHVIIKLNKESKPDNESLIDAMQLAHYFSKARASSEIEVCVTQRKYVSKLGGSNPGKVQVSKHQSLKTRIDKARLKKFNLAL